jgi:transposase
VFIGDWAISANKAVLCCIFYHLAKRREPRIAKVAMVRKLAVSLYWIWRKQRSFQPAVEIGSYAG